MLDEKKNEQQWKKLEELQPIIRLWADKQNAPIYRIDFVTGWGMYLGVYIFYKTDAELKHFTKNNIVEETKNKFMEILDEIGYIKEFNDVVRFSFDSDEHVQRNYKGNYGLRLTDD